MNLLQETMTKPLEETVEKEVEKKGLCKTIADTIAGVTFSVAIGTSFEYFILDLEQEKMLKSRLINAGISVLFSERYAKCRDYLLCKCGVNKKTGFWKKAILNSLASCVFWTPIYTGILYVSGAEPDEIKNGAAIACGLSAFVGGPYGWYLDKVVRPVFGIKSKHLNGGDAA